MSTREAARGIAATVVATLVFGVGIVAPKLDTTQDEQCKDPTYAKLHNFCGAASGVPFLLGGGYPGAGGSNGGQGGLLGTIGSILGHIGL